MTEVPNRVPDSTLACIKVMSVHVLEIHLNPVSGVPIFCLIMQSLLEFSNVFLDE